MAPSNTLDEKTSEMQGSGKTIFYLLKIVGDVIDDELQVSDAHTCAGKKVDMRKRVVRAVESAGSKASVVQAKLGDAKTVGNTILGIFGFGGGIAGLTKLARGGMSDDAIVEALEGPIVDDAADDIDI